MAPQDLSSSAITMNQNCLGQGLPKVDGDDQGEESGMDNEVFTYRGIYLPTLTSRFSDKKLETAYQRYACRQVRCQNIGKSGESPIVYSIHPLTCLKFWVMPILEIYSQEEITVQVDIDTRLLYVFFRFFPSLFPLSLIPNRVS